MRQHTRRSPIQAQRVYGLEVSSAGLAELQDGRRVVFVPAAEIRAVALEHGLLAERPLLQGAASLLMLLAGLYPFGLFLQGLRHGNDLFVIYDRLILMTLVFLGFGAYGIRHTQRRGFFVRVVLRRGTRKLALRPEGAVQGQLEVFVSEVRALLRGNRSTA